MFEFLRQSYPEYQEVPDSELLRAFRRKFPMYDRLPDSEFVKGIEQKFGTAAPEVSRAAPPSPPSPYKKPSILSRLERLRPMVAFNPNNPEDVRFFREDSPGVNIYESAIRGTMHLGENIGTGLKFFGAKGAGGKIHSRFKKAGEYFQPPERLQRSIRHDPGALKDPEWIAMQVAEMAPALAVSMGMGLAGAHATARIALAKGITSADKLVKLARIGGAITGGLAGGSLEGANTYERVIGEGGSEKEARIASSLMTAGSAALNALSVGKMLAKLPPGLMSNLTARLVNGAVEAATEWAEEPWEEISMQVARDPKKIVSKEMPGKMWESLLDGLNVLPASFILGVLGGGMGNEEFEGGRDRKKVEPKTPLGKSLKKDIDRNPDKWEDVAKDLSVIAGRPEESGEPAAAPAREAPAAKEPFPVPEILKSKVKEAPPAEAPVTEETSPVPEFLKARKSGIPETPVQEQERKISRSRPTPEQISRLPQNLRAVRIGDELSIGEGGESYEDIISRYGLDPDARMEFGVWDRKGKRFIQNAVESEPGRSPEELEYEELFAGIPTTEEVHRRRSGPQGMMDVLMGLAQMQKEGAIEQRAQVAGLVKVLSRIKEGKKTATPDQVTAAETEKAVPDVRMTRKKALRELGRSKKVMGEIERGRGDKVFDVEDVIRENRLVHVGVNKSGHWFNVPETKSRIQVEHGDMTGRDLIKILKEHYQAHGLERRAKEVAFGTRKGITRPKKTAEARLREMGKRIERSKFGQAQKEKAELYEKYEPEKVTGGELAEAGVGAEFEIQGEKFEVKKADPGNIVIEDGIRQELDEFDQVEIDRGEIKEGKKGKPEEAPGITHRGNLDELSPEVRKVIDNNPVSFDGLGYQIEGTPGAYDFTIQEGPAKRATITVAADELTPELLQKKIDEIQNKFQKAQSKNKKPPEAGIPGKKKDLREGDYYDKKGNIRVSPKHRVRVMDRIFKGRQPASGEEVQSLVLTGGLPGAGKSTARNELGYDKSKFVVADADHIKELLGYEDRAAEIHETSSAINKEVTDTAIDQGYHVIYDSLLSNYGQARKIIDRVLSKKGKVEIAFVHIDAETSQARSRARAEKGETARVIPPGISVRGHNSSLATFIQLTKDFEGNVRVNWRLYDNNVDFRRPVKVARKDGGKLEIFEPELFDKLSKISYIKVDENHYELTQKISEADLEKREKIIGRRVRRQVGEGGRLGEEPVHEEARETEEGRKAEEVIPPGTPAEPPSDLKSTEKKEVPPEETGKPDTTPEGDRTGRVEEPGPGYETGGEKAGPDVVSDDEIKSFLEDRSVKGKRKEALSRQLRIDFDRVKNTEPAPYIPETGTGERESPEIRNLRKVLGGSASRAEVESAFGESDFISVIIPSIVKNPQSLEHFRGKIIGSTKDFAALLMPLRNSYFESMKVVYVDNENRVIGAYVHSVGNVNSSIVDPSEIASYAPEGTVGVMVAHNHPSGNVTYSTNDYESTKLMRSAVEKAGLKFLDHVITDGDEYYSFSEGAPTKLDTYHLAEGEKYKITDNFLLQSAQDFNVLVNMLRNGTGSKHVIYSGNSMRILAIERFSRDIKNDEIVKKVLRTSKSIGSSGILIDDPLGTESSAKYFHENLRYSGVTLHDYSNARNVSMASTGIISAPGETYTPGIVSQKPPGLTKEEQKAAGPEASGRLRKAQAEGGRVGFKVGLKAADQKIEAIRNALAFREKKRSEIRKDLVEWIRTNLPEEIQGKMLKRVADIRTMNDFHKAVEQAHRHHERHARKILKSEIVKLLKYAKPQIVNKIVKGKFTADVQDKLNWIMRNFSKDRDVFRNRIKETIAQYERGEIDHEKMVSVIQDLNLWGINGMTYDEMQSAYENIEHLIYAGEMKRLLDIFNWQSRMQKEIYEIEEVITGGKGLKAGWQSVPEFRIVKKKGLVERAVNRQLSIDNLLDKLSRYDRGSKPYESRLSNLVMDRIRGSRNNSIKAAERIFGWVTTKASEIFRVKNRGELNRVLNDIKKTEVNLGKFKNRFDDEVELVMTKGQLIKKYMELMDTSLTGTFNFTMGWTQEMKDAVNRWMEDNPDMFDWAHFQMRFYKVYHDEINRVYREIYGVDLPKVFNYSPLARDVDSLLPESVLLANEALSYASTVNGSLKSRTNNRIALKFTDANDVFVNHILRMEHFRNWTNTMRDLRKIFLNKEIRQAIRQYHGRDIMKQVDLHLDRLARGGAEYVLQNNTLDRIRVNFTKAILGVKPLIGLKQVPSLLAYSTEIPIGSLVAGMGNFWLTDPLRNYRTMRELSPAFRKRWDTGFERDISAAMRRSSIKMLAGKKNKSDYFMELIRMGDKFATVQGGWAVFRYHLSKGLDERAAMEKAEQVTSRTQPTSDIETLSSIQSGGSFWKLGTMFQNQPNKYFRIMADNMRNMWAGRKNVPSGLYSLILVGAVMPVLFQWISNALRHDKERLAGALNPLSNMLIIGGLFRALTEAIMGDSFGWEVTPASSSVKKSMSGIGKSRKVVKAMMDESKKVDPEDVVDALEFFGEAGGMATGVPTPGLVRAERAARSGDWRELIWSEYDLKEKEPQEIKKKPQTGRPRPMRRPGRSRRK